MEIGITEIEIKIRLVHTLAFFFSLYGAKDMVLKTVDR